MLVQGVENKFMVAGALSGIASFIFGVHIAIALASFFGACCALMLSERKRTLLMALVFVALSTITGTTGALALDYWLPDFPGRVSAFFFAVCALPLLEGAREMARKIPEKVTSKWL